MNKTKVSCGDAQHKDWKGDSNSVFATLGASNHVDDERASNDYYATDPIAMELLLNEEKFSPKVWECACGGGASRYGSGKSRL